MKPTKKQTLLLNYIKTFTEENNYSPSYREIMTALNLKSPAAVAEHIDNLVKANLLKKSPKEARSLELIPENPHEETQALFREAQEKHKENKEALKILKESAKLLNIEV
ncbi:hypothetical protein FACS1894191_5330 [Clostridia bacterium]|nr:hypothetical protein FACS1894191_5330 [Clostridia bacterium]